MARITDSGIAKEAMRRKLPKGFYETPYRKYFFDFRSSDCDRVLSVRFNKGKQFGGDPKLRICVIFDNNIENVSDDLRPIILDVHAIGGTEIWFAKHNKEWMYSVGIGKNTKYAAGRRNLPWSILKPISVSNWRDGTWRISTSTHRKRL